MLDGCPNEIKKEFKNEDENLHFISSILSFF